MIFRFPTFLAASALVLAPAHALNLVVTDPGDSGAGTLRNAIDTANGTAGDDMITFNLGASNPTIELLSELTVTGTDHLLISAAGLANSVTISPLGASRIFFVDPGASLELVNLELVDGFAASGADGADGDTPTGGDHGEDGGGIYNNNGTVVLRDCLLSANIAGFGGKGGDKQLAANPGNSSGSGGLGGGGGAIFSVGASALIRLEDTVVSGNDAGTGGFAGTLASGALGTVGSGGQGGSGGGIYCLGGRLEIINSTITSNNAGRGGGGGENENGGTGGGGGLGGSGGGIAIVGTELVIVNSTIDSNFAGDGGAGGDVFFDDSDIRGAGGDGGDGGGIWARQIPTGSEAQITASLIYQNRAGNGWAGGSSEQATGGDIGTDGGDGGDGGGILISGEDGAVLTVVNSTILRNDAGEGGTGGSGSNDGTGGAGGDAGNGAGMALVRDGVDYSVKLIHVTVLANDAIGPGPGGLPGGTADGAASSGGGIWEVAGGIKQTGGPGLTLANSVVAINSAGSIPNVGTFTAEGTNFTSGNPQVNILADNGGPTLTVAPLLGSPLLDFGGDLAVPLTEDQRGEPRPFNGVPDLGAFEAKLRPDARIGTNPNPATHRIDNFYTAGGVGQTIAVRLTGTARRSFYLSLQNDGEIDDNLRLTGTRANSTLVANVYRLTGGKANITAQLTAGHLIAAAAPGSTTSYQVEVRARSKKKRARQTLSYRVAGTISGLTDVVQASVVGTKPKKKKKKR